MKKLFVSSVLAFSLVGSAFSLTSCDRVSEAVDNIAVPVPFDIPISTSTTIPFASVKTDSYLKYPEIKTNLDVDAKIKEQYPKLSINNLKSVKLSGINIELTKALLGGSLDAVQNAKLYVKTPTLPEKLVATVTNNTSKDKIIFTPNNEELIEYFKSKENSIVLEIQGRKLTLDEFTININPSFKISVGL